MWDKEILEQCGCWFTDTGECVKDDLDLNKFARVIIEKEREACAKACEEVYTGEEASCDWPTPEMCATAIRARGQA